ncbi:MAG: Sec-dependent nitrous-oxide reductase [Gemmatimonadaceae bacterium]|nr:Sec-dependent nitrous-oxide reductase [Gemmatimonadaceae bacterium]
MLSMPTRFSVRTLLVPAAVCVAVLSFACARRPAGGALSVSDAANAVYVAPGSHDEYYAFMSGGFNGQIGVYGLPSGRRLKTIPVFSQYPENGWGYSEETKPMLNTSYGMIPWDDTHHPALSQTNGEDDGRWLFINANNTPRIARIDLTRMETEEILEIPNAGGNHASPFVTENSEYVVSATRFSVPVPNADVPISDFKKRFKGQIAFIRADRPGQMKVAFQMVVPGFNYDLARAGKGPSNGWMFLSSYNTEQANSLLEVNASQNDKDYVAAVNWKTLETCVAAGKGRTVPADYRHNHMDEFSRAGKSEVISSVLQIEAAACPGSIYFLPTPKSPHGADVDPTGEYIVAGGKLATVIPVHSFTKMKAAIAAQAFEGAIDGIPVLKYDATLAGEVKNPGLGPLHTEFDGKGYAYTSFFISSEVVKWKLGTWEVVDRAPTYYSVGHLMIPGGGTTKPAAKYLVAMNKITKDRYLPTGPELTQSAQLYDISGAKMKLLLDFPTEGEPHYAQAIPASKIKERQVKFFKLAASTAPRVTRTEKESGVSRDGRTVHVRMTAIRSHFSPDNIEGVQVGDTVLFHVTNLEQDWDIPHGFAVMGATNGELLIMPGETRTLRWTPTKIGVYPIYCTDFCSALHQEMQGYVRVSAAGSATALTAATSKGPARTGTTGKQ